MRRIQFLVLIVIMLSGLAVIGKGSKDIDLKPHNKSLDPKPSPTANTKTNLPAKQYILLLEPALSADYKEQYLSRYGITIVSKIATHYYSVRVDPDRGLDAINQKIKDSKYIRYIELNQTYSIDQ